MGDTDTSVGRVYWDSDEANSSREVNVFKVKAFILSPLVYIHKLNLAGETDHLILDDFRQSASTDRNYDDNRNNGEYASNHSFELPFSFKRQRDFTTKNIQRSYTIC
jgi:hypothetical protein